MFGWFYKRLSRGILKEIEQNNTEYFSILVPKMVDFLMQSEEFGEFMTITTDVMMKRGVDQLNRSLGGISKGVNHEIQQAVTENNPVAGLALEFQRTGKLNLKKAIVPLILQGLTKEGGLLGQNLSGRTTDNKVERIWR